MRDLRPGNQLAPLRSLHRRKLPPCPTTRFTGVLLKTPDSRRRKTTPPLRLDGPASRTQTPQPAAVIATDAPNRLNLDPVAQDANTLTQRRESKVGHARMALPCMT
jgi:hypothetical protein